MSKNFYCARCGKKLKVIPKAIPQKGIIMNNLAYAKKLVKSMVSEGELKAEDAESLINDIVEDYADSDLSQLTIQDVYEIADASGYGMEDEDIDEDPSDNDEEWVRDSEGDWFPPNFKNSPHYKPWVEKIIRENK